MGASPWRHACATVIALAAVIHGSSPGAHQSGDPPALIRLRAYLAAYEPKIAELVAEERFIQFEERLGLRRRIRRELVSEIGFLRLPDGQVWLGQRRVQRIDGRELRATGPTLGELFAMGGDGLFARAQAIADENARHNLGAARSINVPTLPLDLLDARHASRFVVEPGATRVLRGYRVQLVTLREQSPPSLVGYDRSRFNRADVRAWVVLESGTLIEAEVDLFPPTPLRLVRHWIRVAFAPDRALDLFVPVELEEQSPRLSGRATYGRFRRFRTSARIVP